MLFEPNISKGNWITFILKKAIQMKVDTEIWLANLTKGDFWSISSVNPIKKVTKEDIKKTLIEFFKYEFAWILNNKLNK